MDFVGRVRHDLVKRMLWAARDRRDVGGAPQPGELRPALIDEEGRPISAPALWTLLREDAPAGHGTALDAFGLAVAAADAAAARDDLDGVLALEPAFEALARALRSED